MGSIRGRFKDNLGYSTGVILSQKQKYWRNSSVVKHMYENQNPQKCWVDMKAPL